MSIWLELVLQSVALGVALAMDAFSVSMANGLNDPGMKKKKMCVIAGTFAGFQFAMPMIGWFCVTTIKEIFAMFERFIPWIALLLLLFIGGKMLLDGIRGGDDEENILAIDPVDAVIELCNLLGAVIGVVMDIGFNALCEIFIPYLFGACIIDSLYDYNGLGSG